MRGPAPPTQMRLRVAQRSGRMTDDMELDVPGLGKIKLVGVLEFRCPCGLKVWEGGLPADPGARALVHKEPRCDDFERMDPPTFIEFCRKRVVN